VKFKFKIDDKVRISKTRMTFEKSYLPGWSEEIFTITSRQASRPPTYRIKDLNGEELKGRFYEFELQKIDKKDDIYRIEKILRKRKRRGVNDVFVRWLGWGSEHDSWIPEAEIM